MFSINCRIQLLPRPNPCFFITYFYRNLIWLNSPPLPSSHHLILSFNINALLSISGEFTLSIVSGMSLVLHQFLHVTSAPATAGGIPDRIKMPCDASWVKWAWFCFSELSKFDLTSLTTFCYFFKKKPIRSLLTFIFWKRNSECTFSRGINFSLQNGSHFFATVCSFSVNS